MFWGTRNKMSKWIIRQSNEQHSHAMHLHLNFHIWGIAQVSVTGSVQVRHCKEQFLPTPQINLQTGTLANRNKPFILPVRSRDSEHWEYNTKMMNYRPSSCPGSVPEEVLWWCEAVPLECCKEDESGRCECCTWRSLVKWSTGSRNGHCWLLFATKPNAAFHTFI